MFIIRDSLISGADLTKLLMLIDTCKCVYRQLFQDYSLQKLGPVQLNMKVYSSTWMTVIGPCIIYH